MTASTIICLHTILYVLLASLGRGECSDGRSNQTHDSLADSFAQIEQNNCTFEHASSCVSKSRRKRYVAFPEGSSFSVSVENGGECV